MKKIISVLLLSVLFSVSANAQYMVYGFGQSSCGEWVAEEKKGGVSYQAMQTWITGFVSGYGYAGRADLEKTDIDAMALFVTNYCNANPLDKVLYAAKELIQALEE